MYVIFPLPPFSVSVLVFCYKFSVDWSELVEIGVIAKLLYASIVFIERIFSKELLV